MGNFTSAIPENQRRIQLGVRFYSRFYLIQEDQVGYSNGDRTINQTLTFISYGFHKVLLVIWIKRFSFEEYCSCLIGSNCSNLH